MHACRQMTCGGLVVIVVVDSPVTLAEPTLLDYLGIISLVAVLGKVAWKMLFWGGGALSEADVVTSVGLV